MKSTAGQMSRWYLKNGSPRFEIEIKHDGLNKFQAIRGDSSYIVETKAHAKMAQWDEMWEKRQEVERKKREGADVKKAKEDAKKEAEERTKEAEAELASMEAVLNATLSVDDTIDWESLKSFEPFQVSQPEKRNIIAPVVKQIPREPQPEDIMYRPSLNLFDRLIRSWREKKVKAAEVAFQTDYESWEQEKSAVERDNEEAHENHLRELQLAEDEYQNQVKAWVEKKEAYERKQREENASVDEKRSKYQNLDPEAIYDYCEMVLSNSNYPDYFPQSYDLQYNHENKILIVDYQLPPKESLPTLKAVNYVVTKDQFVEQHLSEAAQNKLFDSVLYQIALRTVHELYEADTVSALDSVVFNGYVRSINPATGVEQNVCVITMQAGREEFLSINLANVDPRACFKSLKGVGSAKLSTITPVAPLLKMEKEDKRFIDSYDVADSVQEGDNLAMMDWEDFEHLIRELFEKEFAASGGEVKVTRASRDGGIDAVVFDPDPIRGGKIVIQAKRYTNTVGVSAVRDLYGSMMNEGANKGILVSTADYGSDAYEFAKGKPLVLLNGGNLLHLLEKHGHKARIDLKEAKRMLAEI